MNEKLIIPKILLWISVFVLLWTSIMDSFTYGQGINTYATYFFISFILFVLLLRIGANDSLIWNVPIISGLYFISEFFNFLYYPFFPATMSFLVYCTVFVVLLISSMVIIHKNRILFDMKKSNTLIYVFFMTLALGIGYLMQKLAYDGLI